MLVVFLEDDIVVFDMGQDEDRNFTVRLFTKFLMFSTLVDKKMQIGGWKRARHDAVLLALEFWSESPFTAPAKEFMEGLREAVNDPAEDFTSVGLKVQQLAAW